MLFITIGLAVVLSFSAPRKVQASVISSTGAGTFDIRAGDSRLHGLDKDATVPEPSSLALILAGALALLLPKVLSIAKPVTSEVHQRIFRGRISGVFEFGEKLDVPGPQRRAASHRPPSRSNRLPEPDR